MVKVKGVDIDLQKHVCCKCAVGKIVNDAVVCGIGCIVVAVKYYPNTTKIKKIICDFNR